MPTSPSGGSHSQQATSMSGRQPDVPVITLDAARNGLLDYFYYILLIKLQILGLMIFVWKFAYYMKEIKISLLYIDP